MESDDTQYDYIRGGTQRNFYNQEDVESCDCPICNSNNFRQVYFERGNLGIVKCNECKLLYTNPRAKDSINNYSGNASVFYEEVRLVYQGMKKHHRDRNYRFELEKINKYKKSGSLLDIGSNTGFFLKKALDYGYDSEGIEASTALAELASKELNLKIANSFFEDSDYSNSSFDILTMMDVFEHVADPSILLRKAYDVLKDDGILCIKVPNGRYNMLKLKLAKIFRRENKHDLFDSFEHLMHFTHATMKKILDQNGFVIEEMIIPIPIHPPVWPSLVGHSYAFASPAILDWKMRFLRNLFYFIGKIETVFGKKTSFAPDLMFIIKKR